MGTFVWYAFAIMLAFTLIGWGRGLDQARCAETGGKVMAGGPPFFWHCDRPKPMPFDE